jgi:hypothetical protein
MRNMNSVWHELLTYLQSPDGVLKIYKVECTPGENNNCVAADSQPNYVVRPYVIKLITYPMLLFS